MSVVTFTHPPTPSSPIEPDEHQDSREVIATIERQAGTASPAPSSHMTFEQAAAMVIGGLQHALADLLAAAPSEVRKASDVERVFGVNYLLGWQVYRIATSQNPLAAGMHVPGKGAMKKLLTAASRRQVPAEITDRVADAFDAIERLVESDAGDRDEWAALLSSFLPEERLKQELANKQAAFKSIGQLKGIAMEAGVATMLFHPSADGRMVDRAALNGEFGLRRSKPSARIEIGIGNVENRDAVSMTLDGEPTSNPLGTLLPQFSTSPLPPYEMHRLGGMIYYFITGKDVGMRSAVDLLMGDRQNAAMPRYWKPGLPRIGGPAYVIDTPMKQLTVDVFVHKDVYPGVMPQLAMHETGARGWVRSSDQTREHDRLEMHETIRVLPPGLAGARLAHIPRYTEMLEHVYRTVGWDPAQFVGYRLDVQYPMYGVQYTMNFTLPDPPASA